MDNVLDMLTAGASLVAAVGVLVVAYDVRRLNGKFDRLTGRAESLETAHNVHVNTPGLHGIR